MKKINILFIVVAVLLSACFKPDVIPPLMYGKEANTTIADLQKLRTLSAELPTLIEDSIIITGVVTSTDQFGSCYKELFIQDTTGGISLRINNSSYYNKYRIGQRIFVEAKGLYLGNYVSGSRYGFYQIGLYGNSNDVFVHISSRKENQHIFRHDMPDLKPISNPKIITKQSDIVTGIGGDYHTLVKLTNCYFTEANGSTKYFEKLSSGTTISRPIQFHSGTGKVEARISEFCTFAKDILPEGPLNITGILTMFDVTPQLIIRSINDVQIIPPPKILKNYDMTTDPFSQGWTNKQITGEAVWTYSSTFVMINPQGKETECWFVSPKHHFNGEKEVALTFSYRINTGGTGENLQALYSIDGTTWNPLAFTPKTGGVFEETIRLPGNVATNPNLQIAFKYKTTTVSPMCGIYNVAFKANVL